MNELNTSNKKPNYTGEGRPRESISTSIDAHRATEILHGHYDLAFVFVGEDGDGAMGTHQTMDG